MKRIISRIKKVPSLTGILVVIFISFLISRKLNSHSDLPLNTQIDTQSNKNINSKVIIIETENQYNAIVNNKENCVVVQFSAPWCGACNAVKAPFEKISCQQDLKDVIFLRVNVDNSPSLCAKYKVMGIPTFLYIRNGEVKKQAVGFKGLLNFEQDMCNDIRTLLSKNCNLPK